MSAALNYRVQQPLIDALLGDLGIQGGSLAGLARGALVSDGAGKAAPKVGGAGADTA